MNTSESPSVLEPIFSVQLWIRILGFAAMIIGVLYCLSIIGLIIGWLPIWLGVILLRTSKSIDSVVADESEQAAFELVSQIALFFKIVGIAALILFVVVLLGLVVFWSGALWLSF